MEYFQISIVLVQWVFWAERYVSSLISEDSLKDNFNVSSLLKELQIKCVISKYYLCKSGLLIVINSSAACNVGFITSEEHRTDSNSDIEPSLASFIAT